MFSFHTASELPEELLLTFDGYKILLMHGHRYDVKYSLERAISHAATAGADVLLFGHTHTPLEKYIPEGYIAGSTVLEKPLYLFNPGSIGKWHDGGYSFGTVSTASNGIIFGHGRL